MPDNRKPLIYGAFPVCRNYTVRAQLRLTAFGKRCASEANSGVAGPQRLHHHGEQLRPLGLQVQDHLGASNGDRACSAGGRNLWKQMESHRKRRLMKFWHKNAGAKLALLRQCGGGRGIRTHGSAQHRPNDFESFSL